MAKERPEYKVETWLRRDTPICPKHGVMRSYMTRRGMTYYACRTCDLRAKGRVQIVDAAQRLGFCHPASHVNEG